MIGVSDTFLIVGLAAGAPRSRQLEGRRHVLPAVGLLVELLSLHLPIPLGGP